MNRSSHRYLRTIKLGLLAAALLLASMPYALAMVRSDVNDQSVFPRPWQVRKAVRFWQDVFLEYPGHIVIVHDVDDPTRIVDLIDFKVIAKRQRLTKIPNRDARDELALKYLDRYEIALRRFARLGEKAVNFGAIERRIYNVYSRSPDSYAQLLRGKVTLRVQAGMADDFLRAAKRAQKYLPYMEDVFESYGLPRVISRLPFVESMFNPEAKSKVGASGIWQFMPDTARQFMHVNQFIDERNSPYKATRAAAQYLAAHYRELKNWGLAITAYNHGRGGMQRAVRQLGTSDIGQVIDRYRSKTFGFASKNFYAEFLAVNLAYEQLIRSGKITPIPHANPDLVPITISKQISMAQILSTSSLSQQMIEQFNPCILPQAYTTYRYRPLPPYFKILVPRNYEPKVRQAFEQINTPRYALRSAL